VWICAYFQLGAAVLLQEPKVAFDDLEATVLYPCVMFYSTNPGEKVLNLESFCLLPISVFLSFIFSTLLFFSMELLHVYNINIIVFLVYK